MPDPLTHLLERARRGDPAAAGELFPLVYDELRRRAEHYFRAERAGHTLQATALVNEAFLRLVGIEDQAWESKAHFFNAVGRAMRRILVDHARARNAEKRGGGAARAAMGTHIAAPEEPSDAGVDIEALDAALSGLAQVNERASRLVELRYFCGLTEPEAARALGVSLRTAAGDWAFAKAWLKRALSDGAGAV
jgi:RNA polymerase sigma factor (TIGR02999 family)